MSGSDKKSQQISDLDSKAYNRYLQKLSISGYKVPDPYQMVCMNDITKWPEVMFGDIYNYFIKTPGLYTADSMLSYKSLDSYNFYHCGHVRQVLYSCVNKQSPVCVLRSQVMRSQAVNDPPHDVWATVSKKTGSISATHCTCMAGLGETCSHVAAMLFKVEASYRMNVQKSCTDVAAAWNNSFNKKVKPAEIDSIDFSATEHVSRKAEKRKKKGLKGTPKKRRFPKGSERIQQKQVTREEEEQSLKKLWDISQSPAVFSTYTKGYFKNDSDTDTASEDGMTYSVNNIPLPITLTALYRPDCSNVEAKQLKEIGQNIYKSVLADSKESFQLVEKQTRNQSMSPIWHAFRAGRITASKVHDILTARETTSPENLVKRILGYGGHFTSEATTWGLDHEANGLKAYSDLVSVYHTDMTVSPTGLMICHNRPFVGATPDGIRSCKCHDDVLVEVKCPYAFKDQDPNSLLGAKGFYINADGDLIKNHRYYSQVQMQMYVLDKLNCDLIVHTEVGNYITNVKLDGDFCSNMISKCDRFFFNYIMPELLSRSIEQTLPTPRTDLAATCFCGKVEKGRMVTCADYKCATKKFHYVCVGLTRKPKGSNWYCPVCERLSGFLPFPANEAS